jgi:uncharacterized RDD family membrane protein YckC
MSSPAHTASNLAGDYAGAASRTLAYVIDGFVSVGIFSLGVAATRFLLDVVLGVDPPDEGSFVWVVGLPVWEFVYLWYCWSVSGKTPGAALLGIRVVRRNGDDLGSRRALVRTLVFPFSFALFGLGLIGVLVDRERRALHDLAAGSTVVYDWDARAARLRFLARPR